MLLQDLNKQFQHVKIINRQINRQQIRGTDRQIRVFKLILTKGLTKDLIKGYSILNGTLRTKNVAARFKQAISACKNYIADFVKQTDKQTTNQEKLN